MRRRGGGGWYLKGQRQKPEFGVGWPLELNGGVLLRERREGRVGCEKNGGEEIGFIVKRRGERESQVGESVGTHEVKLSFNFQLVG